GEWLRQHLLPDTNIAWANVVSCFPHGTPSRTHVSACAPNLQAQLSVLEPRYLLILGGVALSAWQPDVKIGEARGHWWVAQGGVDVYPEGIVWALATYHPAAVLRDRGKQRDVDE